MIDKMKNLFVNNKLLFSSILAFCVALICIVLRISYAYFLDNKSVSLINSEVGEFDNDISVIIYEQIDNNYYKKVDTISNGYTLSRLDCKDNIGEPITCGISAELDCYYSINNGQITLTSNSRVSCSFYFDNNN